MNENDSPGASKIKPKWSRPLLGASWPLLAASSIFERFLELQSYLLGCRTMGRETDANNSPGTELLVRCVLG